MDKYDRKNNGSTNSHTKSGQGNAKEGPWKYLARLDVLGHETFLHGLDLEKRM